MRRNFTALTCLTLTALALAATAAADPISVQPLRDAGYTVGLAFQPDATCTVWNVSGHGVSTYLNDCEADVATQIARLADPALNYERDWQLSHPEQLQAAQALGGHCYSISRTAPMSDQWRIVGGNTDATVAGADLPGLVVSLPNIQAADGTCTVAPIVSTVPGVDANGNVMTPGDATATAAIDAQATAAAAAAKPAATTATAAAAPTAADLAAAAARPEAISDANAAADAAKVAALADGAPADVAALAARGAGLNALYQLG